MMKHSRLFVGLFIIFALLAQAGSARSVERVWHDHSTVARFQPNANCTITATTNVNRRVGPGTSFGVLGVLEPDTPVTVIGEALGDDDFVWWQLSDESWVRSDVVVESPECAEAAPTPPDPKSLFEPQNEVAPPQTTTGTPLSQAEKSLLIDRLSAAFERELDYQTFVMERKSYIDSVLVFRGQGFALEAGTLTEITNEVTISRDFTPNAFAQFVVEVVESSPGVEETYAINGEMRLVDNQVYAFAEYSDACQAPPDYPDLCIEAPLLPEGWVLVENRRTFPLIGTDNLNLLDDMLLLTEGDYFLSSVVTRVQAETWLEAATQIEQVSSEVNGTPVDIFTVGLSAATVGNLLGDAGILELESDPILGEAYEAFLAGGNESPASLIVTLDADNNLLQFTTNYTLELNEVPASYIDPTFGDGTTVDMIFDMQFIDTYLTVDEPVQQALVPPGVVGQGETDFSAVGNARGTISYGEVVEGELGGQQEDVWVFTGERGDTVVIEVNSLDAQLDPIVALYGISGELLAENDDINYALGNINSRVVFTLEESGKHSIRVGAYGQGGSYELRVGMDVLTSPVGWWGGADPAAPRRSY